MGRRCTLCNRWFESLSDYRELCDECTDTVVDERRGYLLRRQREAERAMRSLYFADHHASKFASRE